MLSAAYDEGLYDRRGAGTAKWTCADPPAVAVTSCVGGWEVGGGGADAEVVAVVVVVVVVVLVGFGFGSCGFG